MSSHNITLHHITLLTIHAVRTSYITHTAYKHTYIHGYIDTSIHKYMIHRQINDTQIYKDTKIQIYKDECIRKCTSTRADTYKHTLCNGPAKPKCNPRPMVRLRFQAFRAITKVKGADIFKAVGVSLPAKPARGNRRDESQAQPNTSRRRLPASPMDLGESIRRSTVSRKQPSLSLASNRLRPLLELLRRLASKVLTTMSIATRATIPSGSGLPTRRVSH